MRDPWACLPSAEEAAKGLEALGRVLAQVPMPPLHEIARMRMGMLWDEQGVWCLLDPEWWRWLAILTKG